MDRPASVNVSNELPLSYKDWLSSSRAEYMPASALVNWKAASTMASRDWRYSSHACPAVLASSAASAVASARLPVASAASWVSPVSPWTI